jgi:nifR3 family TIM-barrel protein
MTSSTNSFWHALPKPLLLLAPMEDVTDAAFRSLIARYGKPSVFYTEFTSADGLLLADEKGKKKLFKKLAYSPEERPIVAQLFTASPERMEAAARLCASLGFDGVDINMGCPDRAVERGGCGAALIKTPELARALIRAAKSGVASANRQMPISVKTRIGYTKNELATWLPALLGEEVASVTIHARTRNELSLVPARWEHVREAVSIRNALGASALIIGNGDLRDCADAREKVSESGADGAMLGRAIFGNPWLFANRETPPTPRERAEALKEHLLLFSSLLSETTSYATMKKHFKAYISGWEGAPSLRTNLMETESPDQGIEILDRAMLIL